MYFINFINFIVRLLKSILMYINILVIINYNEINIIYLIIKIKYKFVKYLLTRGETDLHILPGSEKYLQTYIDRARSLLHTYDNCDPFLRNNTLYLNGLFE